jgi:amino acid transporter
VALAIFVCCLAIHAATVRILFAMARDNALPGASALASVSGTRKVPVVPAVATGAIAALILVVNILNPYAFTIIISLGIIFMYLAYLGVTIPLLQKRMSGWPNSASGSGDGFFKLGGAAMITNVVGVLYGLAMAVNLIWPRDEFYGSLWYQQYGPILATLLVVVVGLAVWFGVQKDRIGVLPEHKA